MRQIGVLITTYASNYNGYLPNDDAGIIGDLSAHNDLINGDTKKWENCQLYRNWNGHLLPFIDTNIKSFAREAKVTMDGNVRWHKVSGYDHFSMTTPPSDPLNNGWAIVNDAFTKGGFQDLKVFICPEIFTNTNDVRAMNISNGKAFPRMKLAEYSGFEELNNNNMGNGIPTTYLANDYFFGKNGYYNALRNSFRLDQINNLSSKALIIEGGICAASYNWSSNDIYFAGGDRVDTYDLALNAYENSFPKTAAGGHKTSFVHDNNQEFWTSFLFNSDRGIRYNESTVSEFNIVFDKKAYMLPVNHKANGPYGYHIVSFIDPRNGETFKSFFDKRGIKDQPSQFDYYYENEFHYLTGNANFLMGDGAVLTKDQAWLYNNRKQLAAD